MAKLSAPVASLLLACAVAVPAAGAGRDYPLREIGAWSVATSSDGRGCFITRDYDRTGDTTLLLGLDVDGTNHLSVLNANWSIKPKSQLKLTFRLSKGGYVGQSAVGMASDGKRGFVTTFETRFPTYFALSEALSIARGTVPVERLPLDGSGAAVAELRRCVGAVRASPPTKGKADRRGDRIPKDPFAKSLDRESRH